LGTTYENFLGNGIVSNEIDNNEKGIHEHHALEHSL
jgi:hypothetical protein